MTGISKNPPDQQGGFFILIGNLEMISNEAV
jgi:hypothetical protein